MDGHLSPEAQWASLWPFAFPSDLGSHIRGYISLHLTQMEVLWGYLIPIINTTFIRLSTATYSIIILLFVPHLSQHSTPWNLFQERTNSHNRHKTYPEECQNPHIFWTGAVMFGDISRLHMGHQRDVQGRVWIAISNHFSFPGNKCRDL